LYMCSLWYRHSVKVSFTEFYRVMIPEAAHVQLRRGPPVDEQG